VLISQCLLSHSSVYSLCKTYALMNHRHLLHNFNARLLPCKVYIHAVIGKLNGSARLAGVIVAKGLPIRW
jgi:hypothetical protein